MHRGVCESPGSFGVDALQNCLPNSKLQTFFCLKRVVLGAPHGLRGRRHRQLHPSIWWLSAGLNLSSPSSHFHPVFLHHTWEHPSHTRFLAAQPLKSNCSKQHKSVGIHLPLPIPLISLPSDSLEGVMCRRLMSLWGFLVPRLPAQEAALFAGMLNPLGLALLFSTP